MPDTLPPIDYDLSSIKDLLAKMRGGVRAASDAGTLAGGRAAVPPTPVSASGAVNYGAMDTPTIVRQAAQQAALEAQSTGGGAGAFARAASAPIGENVAPLATSEAASASSIGQRILAAGRGLGSLGGVARLAGRVALPIAALDTGVRAGELLTPDKLAVGLADMVGTLAQKFGFKNSYAGGVQQYGLAEGQDRASDLTLSDLITGGRHGSGPSAPTAPAAPADRFPVNGSITALSPEDAATAGAKFFQGSATPADGTGYVRNESNGHVTAVDTRGQTRTTRYAPTVRAGDAAAPPVLGGDGGIFTNLSDFTNNFSKYALSQASGRSDRKFANAETGLDIKRNDSIANRESQAQTAHAKQLIAYADILRETTAANKENIKTITGLDGNPIIVDQKAQTAKKVIPTERPTVDKFLTEARKDPRNKGFTDAQLKAYYAKTYGG